MKQRKECMEECGGKYERSDNLEYLGVDWKIILK
jgi:hypothetical protein